MDLRGLAIVASQVRGGEVLMSCFGLCATVKAVLLLCGIALLIVFLPLWL